MRKWFLLATLAAGCGEANPPQDVGAARAEIDALIKQYHDKLIRGDIDGVVALLDPEFSISFSGQDTVYGRDPATAVLKGFVEFYKAQDILGKRKPRFGEIRIRQDGNVALATYTVAFIDDPGKPAFEETFTHILRRTGGKWLFLHDQHAPKKS
jgi:ketosteroid isomerase-like protein